MADGGLQGRPWQTVGHERARDSSIHYAPDIAAHDQVLEKQNDSFSLLIGPYPMG